MRLVDLEALHRPLAPALTAAFTRSLETGRFVLGPEVEALEQELAQALGVREAIGVSSGTDALSLALEALGVGPGDRVITSAFSFYSTAGVIARLGAVPVFVDIEAETYGLDPEAVERSLRAGPAKVLLPVHLFGQGAHVAELQRIAAAYGVPMLEDAAQALTGTTPDAAGKSRALGAFGALGAYSFFPTKNLGALGDGGLVVTDDPALGARVRSLRTYGAAEKHRHLHLGANFRLDALQAAFLRVKRPHLPAWNQARRRHAQAYAQGLAGLPLQLPATPHGAEHHVFHQFVVRVPRELRASLRAHLDHAGIDSEVYYPVPLADQPCFLGLAEAEPLPQTRRACLETLALPVHPTLSSEDVARVIAALRRFFEGPGDHTPPYGTSG